MQSDFLSSLVTFLFLITCCAGNCFADTLVVAQDGSDVKLEGELLYTARDNSILFESQDGQLHIFMADDIIEFKEEVETKPALGHEELGASLLADLPKGFKVHFTENYVIAYQNELAFAKWIEQLYEKRLIKEFEKTAKKNLKYKLEDSRFPLPIVVFESKPEYDRYTTRELGVEPGGMIAHYSQMTNRVAMYDLTFDFAAHAAGEKRPIAEVLARRDAIPMVTTIIHEGTHQLMFNRGMQTRLADAPLWLNEGMANWFETPDLTKRIGWQRPGLVNGLRLNQLRRYLSVRPENSLETLISSDLRFENEGALEAYAESWALVHFLMKRRRKEFRAYLKAIASKRPGYPVDKETRVKEFVEYFKDLNKLDAAFQIYVRKLKLP